MSMFAANVNMKLDFFLYRHYYCIILCVLCGKPRLQNELLEPLIKPSSVPPSPFITLFIVPGFAVWQYEYIRPQIMCVVCFKVSFKNGTHWEPPDE